MKKTLPQRTDTCRNFPKIPASLSVFQTPLRLRLRLRRRAEVPRTGHNTVMMYSCMKFGPIKTFVPPHWLIIWQIGAPLCVDSVGEPVSPTHPSPPHHLPSAPTLQPNKEATGWRKRRRKKFLCSLSFLFSILCGKITFFFTTFWVFFFLVGSPRVSVCGRGAAVSAGLKRFSQAEIFNLLRGK